MKNKDFLVVWRLIKITKISQLILIIKLFMDAGPKVYQ